VTEPYDVALIGGGVMSATLGTLLSQLEPTWKIAIFERLGDVARESSDPWNNAGTGHSALCELNYTPERPDGSIDIANAVKVNEQFQVSRQFWSYLVGAGLLPEPSAFINPVPHMSFVWGADNVAYLKKRFEALKDHPLFAGLEYTEDDRLHPHPGRHGRRLRVAHAHARRRARRQRGVAQAEPPHHGAEARQAVGSLESAREA
jgi:malate dehydrogenase (quinone)